MKVLAFTSIRSDYDLLTPLYKLLHKDSDIDFRLLVSGAHLSTDYGLSVEEIRQDGFNVLMEIETLINSDSKKSKIKTASLLLQNSIDVVDNFNPDLIIIVGDREDVIMASLVGLYLQIPIIHFFGGDHEVAGHEDTVIRHATSKIANLHFVASEEHKQRLIKMGEDKKRIFNVGNVALDKFFNYKHIDIYKILKVFSDNFDETKKIALVIYHPSPNGEENKIGDTVLENIINAIMDANMIAFISSPNTDHGNKKIIQAMNKFKNNPNVVFFKNLDRNQFLSVFTQCEFIIGNSSAGIIEAATIKKAAINVGERQKGRMCSKNVVFCSITKEDISNAIKKVCSVSFQKSIKSIVNPYGDGHSANKVYKLIKTLNFKDYLLKIEDPLND